MGKVSAAEVKKLREMTNLPMMECKRALEETDGDLDQAVAVLRKKSGLKTVKNPREAAVEGCIECYIHNNGKLAAMAELRCETDFVARNEDFRRLCREICMHIAATDPVAIDRTDVPTDLLDREKAIFADQVQGKPEHIVDKILEGKLADFYRRVCLLEQPFVKDESRTIGDLIAEQMHKMDENIFVARFARYAVGE
jgi:elongation factor Ts